jgi:hypothetical protein
MGFAWAGLAVTIFSGWFVVTRFSLTRELQIWDVAALRFGIGALLLAHDPPPRIMPADHRLERGSDIRASLGVPATIHKSQVPSIPPWLSRS